MIGVNGLTEIQNFKRTFVMADIGYTTGVAYINNCTANPISTVKSRYFVVIDEMIIPSPSPSPAMMRTRRGSSNKVEGLKKLKWLKG